MILQSPQEARAKLFAAKLPLEGALPFITSFLRPCPVTVTATPQLQNGRVVPCYVTPRPECVFGLETVSKYELSELRTQILHENIHVLGDVFGRCGDRDWDTWVLADDLKANAIIQEEINRLNRLGLNGTDRKTALLAWPHDNPPALDYRFYGLGWTTEAIYDVLIEEKRSGNPRSYPEHRDCPEEFRGTPAEVREGQERIRRALYQATLEAQESGWESTALQELAFEMVKPRFPWSTLLAQEIERRLDLFERRSYLHPRPRDWDREDGLLVPGTVAVGDALAFAPDVSQSSTRKGGPASRFLAEVESGASSHDGLTRIILWDDQVRSDVCLEGGQPMRPLLEGVRGSSGTRIRCLFERLQGIAYDPSGAELPMPGFLVILTDGAVSDWPEPEEWPCEVLVVYTHQAPPDGYAAIHMDLEEVA